MALYTGVTQQQSTTYWVASSVLWPSVCVGLRGFRTEDFAILLVLLQQQQQQPPPQHAPQPQATSLYIKNLPPETDKLFLYERFAPHGSIASVKVGGFRGQVLGRLTSAGPTV